MIFGDDLVAIKRCGTDMCPSAVLASKWLRRRHAKGRLHSDDGCGQLRDALRSKVFKVSYLLQLAEVGRLPSPNLQESSKILISMEANFKKHTILRGRYLAH